MSKAYPGFPEPFPVRSDERRSMRFRVVSMGLRFAFTTLLSGGLLHIEGEENIPADGPLLVVANHLSDLDPLMFGAFFPGTLYAMGKSELFANPLAAWTMGGCNSFPVERGSPDRWALRTALAILRRPGRLLILPEGTRSRTGAMQRAEPGVSFLIKRSGADVLPVGIWGTERVLVPGTIRPRRAHVHLRYGKPVPHEQFASGDAQAVADRVGATIAPLIPERYRGVYSAAE